MELLAGAGVRVPQERDDEKLRQLAAKPYIIENTISFACTDETHSLLYDLYLRFPQRRPLASRVRRDTLPTEEEEEEEGDESIIVDSTRGLEENSARVNGIHGQSGGAQSQVF